MPPYVGRGRGSLTAALVALVIVTAVLYLAREVLIPLALSILFGFLLAPAVRRLESWRLHRVPATLIVATIAAALRLDLGNRHLRRVLLLVGAFQAVQLLALVHAPAAYAARVTIHEELVHVTIEPHRRDSLPATRSAH